GQPEQLALSECERVLIAGQGQGLTARGGLRPAREQHHLRLARQPRARGRVEGLGGSDLDQLGAAPHERRDRVAEPLGERLLGLALRRREHDVAAGAEGRHVGQPDRLEVTAQLLVGEPALAEVHAFEERGVGGHPREGIRRRHHVGMPDASTMLLFAGASALILAFPGPAVIFLVTRSAEQGRAAGVVSLLGVETGTLVYALAAAAGLAGLIAASATAFAALKYVGAVYLLYLGMQRLRSRGPAPERPAPARSRLYASGLTVQLLNPKIAVFFVAFLPQFAPRHGSAVLTMLT